MECIGTASTSGLGSGQSRVKVPNLNGSGPYRETVIVGLTELTTSLWMCQVIPTEGDFEILRNSTLVSPGPVGFVVQGQKSR